MAMRTRSKWFFLVGLVVIALYGIKSYRVTPERISPEKYQQVLDEITSVDFSLSYLTPDHSGRTVAYIRASKDMRELVLLDMHSLERKRVAVTNEVIQVNGWSPDDRYLTFVQLPPQPEKKHKTGVLKESWLTIYSRSDDSTERLTEETNVVESYFFWLTTNAYLFVSRGLTMDYAEIFMGSLQSDVVKKVSNYRPELVVMSENMAGHLEKGNIVSLEIKPLKDTDAGTNHTSPTVRVLSDFKDGQFDQIKWLRYSRETDKFLFCARPTNSTWRYLFGFDPRTRELTQLSQEDTYNGQWLGRGAGYAYVVNTNNAFHLAVKTKEKAGHTNLFTRGNVLNYAVAPSGDRLYAAAALGVEPHGIWEYDLPSHRLRQIASGVTTAFLASRIVEPQESRMKCFDGLETPCFLFPPVQLADKAAKSEAGMFDRFLPGAKYPLVIYVPPTSSQFQCAFNPQAQTFVNAGFYFAAINYRGCDGYGADYSKLANTKDAARDVLDFYRVLIKNPNIDRRNVFLSTSSAGMSIVSELLATQPTLWRAVGLDKPGGCPVDARFEPDKFPPTLIIMGEEDKALESMERFVAWAASNHIEIKSVLHTNTGHITYNLRDRKDTQHQLTDFFLKHLK